MPGLTNEEAPAGIIVQSAYTRNGNVLSLYNPPLMTTSPALPVPDLIDNCGVDSP